MAMGMELRKDSVFVYGKVDTLRQFFNHFETIRVETTYIEHGRIITSVKSGNIAKGTTIKGKGGGSSFQKTTKKDCRQDNNSSRPYYKVYFFASVVAGAALAFLLFLYYLKLKRAAKQ